MNINNNIYWRAVMPSHTKKKVKEMHVGKNLRATTSALMSDVKEIVKDTKDAAIDTLDYTLKNAKKVLQKVEKKLS